MSQDPEEVANAAARAFVNAAHAMESWDLIELRQALRLPSDTPLDRLADLVARLHHLPMKTPEAVEQALRDSSARPWIERNRDLQELAARLPAVFAFVSIEKPSPLSTDVVFVR